MDSLLKEIKGEYMLTASIFSFIIIAASLVNFAYGQEVKWTQRAAMMII